jgi:2-polyprenyl-3-methyl-5-hydroxy-6-metoxy-1,4-benzoquinol methylase
MTNTVAESSASYYDQNVRRSGFSSTHRYLLEHIAPNATVLELSPASGYMTQALAAKGYLVDAIELNPHDAAKAAPYCRKMIVGSVEDLENFAGLAPSYDVILMADVLEHLRAPEDVLQKARQLVAPNGVALVSLPNIAYWKMRLELSRGRFEYADSGLLDRTHLRFFTLKTGQAMFTRAGFEIVHIATPPPTTPRFGRLKERVKNAWPTLFSVQFIFHLRSNPGVT